MLENVKLTNILGVNMQELMNLNEWPDSHYSYQNLSEFRLIKGPSLEGIISNLPHNVYEIKKPRDNDYSPSNVAQIIWDFLSSRPGKIRRSGPRCIYNEEKYIQKIVNSIKKERPIELFLMMFSPKFASPLISGDDVLPDLSNLLALQHLVDIGLPVREVYEPGIRFVAVYEGGLYQELGKFTNEIVQQTYKQIKYFNKLIEEKEGISGIVDIVDGKSLSDALGMEFINALKKEENRLDNLYRTKNDINFICQFDEWRNKFALGIIDLNKLIKEQNLNHKPLTINEWLQVLSNSPIQDPFLEKVRESAYEVTYRMGINYFAFQNLKYSFGSENLGIMKDYPDAISITARANKKRLAIQLIPGNSRYPHHGITVWDGKKWRITRLINLARYPKRFVGVYLSGKEYAGRRPFYYLLKGTDYPEFSKPSVLEEAFPTILSKRGYRMLKDLSHKATMGSRLFLAQDSGGNKVIIKYASADGFQGSFRSLLQKEAERLKEIMKVLGPQEVFPRIIECYNDDVITYYITDFFPNSETVMDYLARLPRNKSYTREVKKITQKLLTILSEEVYSKGRKDAPERYLSTWHLDRLRQAMDLLVNDQSDIFSSYIKNKKFKVNNIEYKNLTELFKKIFAYKTVRINGAEFLNLPQILNVIKQNEEKMNKLLNPINIPLITHGDLHLNNVLRNVSGDLLLIDPHGRRPINAVESELGRITLSYFAEFLRRKNYDIDIYLKKGELAMNLYYNRNNKELIHNMSKSRDTMLAIVEEHKGIYEWIKNTKDWRSHVLLTEAIHIAVPAVSKFPADPSGKLTLGCYIIGTVLLNKALARMGFISSKYGKISSPMELFIPQ